MKSRLSIVLKGLTLSVLVLFSGCGQADPRENSYDIVIYGGTSREWQRRSNHPEWARALWSLEPTNRLGGLTTGGLGQTDIGNKQAIGGVSREFYQHIAAYYNNPDHWQWQQKQEYMDGGQTRTGKEEDAMWTFEPSAALNVYQEMLKSENVVIRYKQRLDRDSGVEKKAVQSSPSPWSPGRCTKAKSSLMLPMKET